MPPSGVNDSWRAAMGAIKRAYDRDHAGGWCTVGGTGSAITLSYAVAPASYVQGEKYAFKASAANTGATTVNVNGLGAKNVYKKSSAGAAACTGGEIQSGDIVELEYDGTQFQLLSNASFAGGTLTSAINEAQVVSSQPVVSGTLDISGIAGNNIQLSETGGGIISSFGPVPGGARRIVYFTGASPGTLTNSVNLLLPGGKSIPLNQFDIVEIYFTSPSAAVLVAYTPYVDPAIYGKASAATTLTGTDVAQFLTAGGFAGNKSMGTSGYYKLPGGLIIQWGSVSIGGSSSATFSFVIGFPSNVFAVTATGAGGGLTGVNAGPVGLSSAVINNNSSNPQTAYVIAIGN
jgi:hypothetical protein